MVVMMTYKVRCSEYNEDDLSCSECMYRELNITALIPPRVCCPAQMDDHGCTHYITLVPV